MDYKKIYDNIISKAKSEIRIKLNKKDPNYIYYEKHHILPKCLGGTNNEENLVLLTGREHFICHKLLIYIYNFNKKLCNAYCYITFSKKFGKITSSRNYEYARWLKSNIPVSEETKKRCSESNKNKHNYKHTEYSKQKIKENNPKYFLGKNLSKNHKEKISNALKITIKENNLRKGEKNGFFDKHHTKETKEKLKKIDRSYMKSLEYRNKMRFAMSGEKNPMFGKHHTKESIEKIRRGNEKLI
jgi:hypothetical protein